MVDNKKFKLVTLHIPGSTHTTHMAVPIEDTTHLQGGEGSGNFGHEGRPGEVGGSGEGGGGAVSDKSKAAISKGITREVGSTPESEWDDSDKEGVMRSVARQVTKTYSWGNRMDNDDPSTFPPKDKPYGTLSFESGSDVNEFRPELKVANSYGIKDDLKSRGYGYSDREWYIAGTPPELKGEVDYLKGKGITTKFGESRFGKTQNILLGQKNAYHSTVHTDLIAAAITGSVNDGTNKIASTISQNAEKYGVEQT
jgi:hypothetical protein